MAREPSTIFGPVVYELDDTTRTTRVSRRTRCATRMPVCIVHWRFTQSRSAASSRRADYTGSAHRTVQGRRESVRSSHSFAADREERADKSSLPQGRAAIVQPFARLPTANCPAACSALGGPPCLRLRSAMNRSATLWSVVSSACRGLASCRPESLQTLHRARSRAP